MKTRIFELAASLLVGMLLGWWIWHPGTAPVEVAAPAKVLPSGGILVERSPEAHVPKPVRQAAREVKGGKLERVITVGIIPRPVPPMPPTVEGEKINMPPPACSCERVDVELGLVRMPDQTRRVVATAKGGDIVGALDIPVERLSIPKSHPWAAGVSAQVVKENAEERLFGAWLERDLGPFRFGAELQATKSFTNKAVWVKGGFRW